MRRIFGEKGEGAARKRGLALELQPGTPVSWFGTWKREAEAEKKAKGKKA